MICLDRVLNSAHLGISMPKNMIPICQTSSVDCLLLHTLPL